MSLIRVVAGVLLWVVVLLLLFQNRMIYHPRGYGFDTLLGNPGLVRLSFLTGQGKQRAFYLPPRAGVQTTPAHLWVLFPGNGSLAVDWVGFLGEQSHADDGFLMVDYPGYGDCQGAPSPAAIQESAEGAFACLAKTLHVEPASLEAHLCLLCHSIGCATGLNFAVRHPVERIILSSPFTTLRDMAQRTVGWPLCWLLLHNYDNADRLRELAARPRPPRVTIFHGEDDSLVPIAMGRKLAAMFPRMIRFHAVPGAGHNSVLVIAGAQIAEAIRE